MTRPKGTPNKPTSQKAGIKKGQHSILKRMERRMTEAEILDNKVAILRLMTEGEAEVDGKKRKIYTISDAARVLGLLPGRVYGWCKYDKDFQSYIETLGQVMADDIESKFLQGKNDIPLMMLLKGKRPEYRDNFKIEHTSEKLEGMLEELKNLGQAEKAREDEDEEITLDPAQIMKDFERLNANQRSD